MKTNINSYVLYRIVPLLMTFSKTEPHFLRQSIVRMGMSRKRFVLSTPCFFVAGVFGVIGSDGVIFRWTKFKQRWVLKTCCFLALCVNILKMICYTCMTELAVNH